MKTSLLFTTLGAVVMLQSNSVMAATEGVTIVVKETHCQNNPQDAVCSARSTRALSGEDKRIIAIEDHENGEQLWISKNNYKNFLKEKQQAYQSRVATAFGPELTALQRLRDQNNVIKENPALPGKIIHPLVCGNPPTDRVPDGQGDCKLIFGNDSRTIVPDARSTYPATKFVTMTVDRYSDSTVQAGTCSGTFLDEDHVITAAHCVYDTSSDDWIYANPGNNDTRPPSVDTPLGRDTGRGYVCLSGWMNDETAFTDNCEFVQSRWLMMGYVNAASSNSIDAIEYDVAILKLRRDNHPSGLGLGTWVAMSSIDSASTLETKLAVAHGYPAVHPPGLSWNMDDRDWNVTGWYDNLFQTVGWEIWGARQYKTYGDVDSPTTSTILRTKLESSGGQSGSGIFYYSNDDHVYSGQSHYLIGVLAATEADLNFDTSNDHVIGPTVGQFRDFANTILP